MKIRAIETVRLEEYPNLLLVQVVTDEGLVGLGETFFGAAAVEAFIHETAAPYLLGQDPSAHERHCRRMVGYVGYGSAGVETRGISALDIAMWDIAGQAAGVSIAGLLGGPVRTEIPVYNTCAGPSYVRKSREVSPANWGLEDAAGPYEDLDGFLHRPAELAASLLGESIRGMKIWPFDPAALRSAGQDITVDELETAIAPIRTIREAVGMHIEVMIELHGLWSVPLACRIARSLEPFGPAWIEDPTAVHDFAALDRVRRSTRIPVAAGETLGDARSHRNLVDAGGADILIVDVSWVGGITEARRVADVAEARSVQVAFHNCSGPVTLMASLHLALASPTAASQEIVRAFMHGWHQDLVTGVPAIRDGCLTLPTGPGLGMALRPDLRARPDARVRVSTGA